MSAHLEATALSCYALILREALLKDLEINLPLGELSERYPPQPIRWTNTDRFTTVRSFFKRGRLLKGCFYSRSAPQSTSWESWKPIESKPKPRTVERWDHREYGNRDRYSACDGRVPTARSKTLTADLPSSSKRSPDEEELISTSAC